MAVGTARLEQATVGEITHVAEFRLAKSKQLLLCFITMSDERLQLSGFDAHRTTISYAKRGKFTRLDKCRDVGDVDSENLRHIDNREEAREI